MQGSLLSRIWPFFAAPHVIQVVSACVQLRQHAFLHAVTQPRLEPPKRADVQLHQAQVLETFKAFLCRQDLCKITLWG